MPPNYIRRKGQVMKKGLLKCATVVSAFAVALTIFASPASAISYQPNEYRLSGVSNKTHGAYQNKNIYVSDVQIAEGAVTVNGITYVPLRSFASAVAPGASITYNSSNRTMTIKAIGLYLSATDGAYVVYANDRPLFEISPTVILSNGKMYIPLTSAAKAFGVQYSDGESLLIKGSFKPLAPASSFYRDDEVLWLARIISAESRGEPLLGQIAVGNVILNRRRSPDFPNTIYGVIFDRKYGVQFTPVANGTIYNTPGYTSTLAAKICLEGTTLSEDVLFFMEPRLSTSSWISSTRPYYFTVGNHDFFG